MDCDRVVQAVIRASEHSGDDFVLWLRYLRKWVSITGHIFSEQEVVLILNEDRIRKFHRMMFSEAITPGTPTNRYVIWLNQPMDASAILERIRRIEANRL